MLIKVPFWLLIAAIFVYALFPFYWAVRSAFTPEAELFNTPISVLPEHPTLQNFTDVLSSSFFRTALLNSTIVAGSRDADLAVHRLARGVRARPFPLPWPLPGDVPDALDDDLPADRHPRRPLHDVQRLKIIGPSTSRICTTRCGR